MPVARLSIKQTQQAFGVAHMTIHLWRKGTATKDPLPFEVDDPKAIKPRVYFRVSALKTWARKNGVEFAIDPATLLASEGEDPRRPGPKPRKARTKH